MKLVAVTDKGRRPTNEDSFFKYRNDRLFGGMVADGMGGHNKGDVASKLAADIIKDHIMSNFKSDMESFDVAEMLRSAVSKANERIFQMSVKNPICKGMGTTVTMAFIYDDNIITAHVGDCRCYLVSQKGAKKITKDHSYVNELIERGAITEEEAKKHPKRNYITRAVGTERSITVDINVRRYNGETVLIASDGLWAYVDEDKLCELINDCEDFELVGEHIVEMAILNDSDDNVTAVVFRKEITE